MTQIKNKKQIKTNMLPVCSVSAGFFRIGVLYVWVLVVGCGCRGWEGRVVLSLTVFIADSIIDRLILSTLGRIMTIGRTIRGMM